MNFLQPRSLLLALDHLNDQLQHVGVAGGLDVTGLNRLAVTLHGAALGELVELGAINLNQNPLVLRKVLADLWPRDLDPVELDIVARFQLKAEDELQLLQRRDLKLYALSLHEIQHTSAIDSTTLNQRHLVVKSQQPQPISGDGVVTTITCICSISDRTSR